MNAPLVSVVIPNCNYGRYLGQAIESVLNQSYGRIEVLVVDDGSTDDSDMVARRYAERIRWIEQSRLGVSAARNRGARESKGELLAFLDADDLWLPAKLERQVQRFLDDPALGLVHCGSEDVTAEGLTIRRRVDGIEGWVAKDLLLLRRPVILGGGSSIVASRETFRAVGGFDERLSTSADWDFNYRVALRQRVGFVRDVLLKYRVHGSNMHANVRLMEHDMLLAFRKAFEAAPPDIERLRSRCYGNLHMTLAGSFYQAGLLREFAIHAARSLRYAPGNCTKLLGYPFRVRARMKAAQSAINR